MVGVWWGAYNGPVSSIRWPPFFRKIARIVAKISSPQDCWKSDISVQNIRNPRIYIFLKIAKIPQIVKISKIHRNVKKFASQCWLVYFGWRMGCWPPVQSFFEKTCQCSSHRGKSAYRPQNRQSEAKPHDWVSTSSCRSLWPHQASCVLINSLVTSFLVR